MLAGRKAVVFTSFTLPWSASGGWCPGNSSQMDSIQRLHLIKLPFDSEFTTTMHLEYFTWELNFGSFVLRRDVQIDCNLQQVDRKTFRLGLLLMTLFLGV